MILSLPSRGAWIEIGGAGSEPGWGARRSPHGERGLKLDASITALWGARSLPSRGAWIEMDLHGVQLCVGCRRSPHGERGLKSNAPVCFTGPVRRSPHGERGLKFCLP